MLTTIVFGLAAVFTLANGYYPQDNLYYMGFSLTVAGFVTAIAEFVVWQHNLRVAKEQDELNERINSVVIKDARFESKGTTFPTRGN